MMIELGLLVLSCNILYMVMVMTLARDGVVLHVLDICCNNFEFLQVCQSHTGIHLKTLSADDVKSVKHYHAGIHVKAGHCVSPILGNLKPVKLLSNIIKYCTYSQKMILVIC